LYGFHQKYWEGKPSPKTVSEAAADYIQRMKSIQPAGPYFLSGYSYGGVVVYEMAQQLISQGDEIALLMLIVPSTSPLMKHAANKVKNFFKSICRRPIYMIGELYLRNGKRIPYSLRNNYGTELNLRAMRKYSPRPYPGRVVLITTKMERVNVATYWGKLALKGIDLHEVAGDHFSIFNGRDRADLLKTMSSCMKKAQNAIAKVSIAKDVNSKMEHLVPLSRPIQPMAQAR